MNNNYTFNHNHLRSIIIIIVLIFTIFSIFNFNNDSTDYQSEFSDYVDNFTIENELNSDIQDEKEIILIDSIDSSDKEKFSTIQSSTSFSINLTLNKTTQRINNVLQSYSFVRSGVNISYAIFPAPQSILINWDDSTNSSVISPTPSISTVSEIHILNFFTKDISNNWEKYSFSIIIDNTAVITIITSPTNVKVTGFETISLMHDKSTTAVTWAWNSAVYTALPSIKFPVDGSENPIQGNQVLRVRTIDSEGRAWDFDFPFFVDWTPPTINLLNAFNNSFYESGTLLHFENKTPIGVFDDRYNFTFQWDSGSYFNYLPTIPAPNGLYKLTVFLADEIGNVGNKTYFFTSTIGLYHLIPLQSGKPNQVIDISFTETPVFENYSISYTNITNQSQIISQTDLTSPGNLPDINQNVDFTINVKDSGNHWFNKTYFIKVDGYPIQYISSNLANNSIFTQNYADIPISLTFNETPHLIIYNFNNTNINTTIVPKIPLSTGNYELKVFFSDLAGNWDNISLFFTRVIKIDVNITNNQIINPNSILRYSFSGNITDFYKNSTFGTMVTNNFIDVLTPSPSRDYSFTLQVLSNSTIATLALHYYIRINSFFLDDSSKTFKSGLKVNFTFSETPYSWFYVWDTPNNVNNFKFDSNPKIPSNDGSHTLYVKTYNSINNLEFVNSISFTTDDTAPVFTPTNFINNSIYRANYSLTFTTSPDILTKEYSWNNGVLTNLQTVTTPYSNSNQSLQVFLIDKAGNTANYFYIIVVDYEKPIIFSSKENNTILSRSDQIEFNFSEPIDTDSSYYIFNNVTKSVGQIIVVKDFLWGNYSVNITFSIFDIYKNNIVEVYYFTVIDPSLQYSVSDVPNSLIIDPNKQITFNMSKEIKSFEGKWYFTNDTELLVDYISTKKDLTYFTSIPQMDGSFVLKYTIKTMDDYVLNGSLPLNIDITNPKITLTVFQVKDKDESIVRQIISSESENIYNITSNDLIIINIEDYSSVDSSYSISYSNGSVFSLTSQKKIITFLSPGINEKVNVTITTTDGAGHSTTMIWQMQVFDKPNFQIPSFEYIIVLFSLVTILLTKKRSSKRN